MMAPKRMTLPLQGEFAMNFDENGPQWGHQKSFYSEDSPRSYASTPLPTAEFARPRGPARARSPSTMRSASTRRQPSLSDNVDLFVDDKFYKTHNKQFGPAVININEDHTGASSSGSNRGGSGYSDSGYRPPSSAGGFSYTSPSPSSALGSRSGASSVFPLFSDNASSPPSTPNKPTPNAFSYGKIPPRVTSSHDYDKFGNPTRSPSSMSYGSSPPSSGFSQARRGSYSSNSGSSAGTIVVIGNPRDFEQKTISFSFDPEKRLVKSDGTLVDSHDHPGLRI
ncbi:hypothetical protein RvY_07903 [Ramazzottius varieornatus]|uniref:Uncharacterized protein n=1 Tax=Ramazzottius varieornatus TaxID=947166 RepID=A0A1D1V425_RAMVA|nr:hypothetical protein RvY_07903 [Ramazzottius varieornatus]